MRQKFFAAALLSVLAAPAFGAGLTAHPLPTQLHFPEGIAYDATAGVFYTASAADGTVARVERATGRSEVLLPANTLFPSTDLFPAALGVQLDSKGRVWIAGGRTGQIFIVDPKKRRVEKILSTGTGGLLNDIAFAGNAAYITDTIRPTMWRVDLRGEELSEPQRWLDFSGTPIEYIKGANLNGIAVTADGRVLIVGHMQKGQLFKIDLATKHIAAIDVKGEPLAGADGLVLDGSTLYVVRQPEAEIATIKLSKDMTSGQVLSRFKDAGLLWPSTAARVDGGLLVVNSQMNKRNSNVPSTPFTVSVVSLTQLQGQ